MDAPAILQAITQGLVVFGLMLALAWVLARVALRHLRASNAIARAQRQQQARNRRRRERDETGIERQIATLRSSADRAVASRPSVRATSLPAAQAAHTESASKAWLRGVCCHTPDCADVHCPGRLQARVAGTGHSGHPLPAKVAVCKPKQAKPSAALSVDAINSQSQTGA